MTVNKEDGRPSKEGAWMGDGRLFTEGEAEHRGCVMEGVRAGRKSVDTMVPPPERERIWQGERCSH